MAEYRYQRDSRFATKARAVLLGTLLAAALPGTALADAARGQALWYNPAGVKNNNALTSCQACHALGPASKIGRTAATINALIAANFMGMGIYNNILNVGGAASADMVDLELYLANPAAVPLAIANAPASVTFGNQGLGTTSAAMVATVSHGAGSAAPFQLAAVPFTLAGANAADFAIAAGGTCAANMTLAVGQNCTVNLTFTPTGAVGGKNATLQVAFATASVPMISVLVNGNATSAPTPTIALSATTLTLANTVVAATSAAQTVTLTNSGAAVLNLTALTAGGANPTEFTRTGTCVAPGTVAAGGGTCTLIYTFTPAATGARSANLVIASNNPGGNVTLTLAGTGAANTPTFFSTPATLTFNTALGSTSAAQNVTVRNDSGGTLTVTSAVSSSTAYAATVPATCAALTINQTCTIGVTFTPAALGAATANLTIAHNAGASAVIALNGTGVSTVPLVVVAPATVSLPLTAVGQQSATSTVTFTNNGPGAVTLNTATATTGFVLTTTGVTAPVCTNGMSIAQGALCRIGVRSAPTAAGALTGTLTFASTGSPANATVPLSGTGSATATPIVNYTPEGGPVFGATQAGTTATAPIRITVTNRGTANMAFPASNVATISTGFNPTDFRVRTTTCAASAPLLPNTGNCTIDIDFAPVAAGSAMRTAILMVNFTGGSAQVPLSGVVEGATGAAPTAPPPSSGSAAPTAPAATPAAKDDGGGGALNWQWLVLLLLFGVPTRRRFAETAMRKSR